MDKYFKTLKPLPPEHEIIDRLLFSQIIEALYCYEEGVLNSNSEANIGSIYGWGFPSPVKENPNHIYFQYLLQNLNLERPLHNNIKPL